MFNAIFLLTALPTWLAGMYLLHLLWKKRQEEEKAAQPVRIPVEREG